MKKALFIVLILGSLAVDAQEPSETDPSTQNRSLLPESVNTSLKSFKTKTFYEKSVLAAKGIGAGLAGYALLYTCIFAGKNNVQKFLDPKVGTWARFGGMSVFLFYLAMTAEMTNYSLRSMQDLM